MHFEWGKTYFFPCVWGRIPSWIGAACLDKLKEVVKKTEGNYQNNCGCVFRQDVYLPKLWQRRYSEVVFELLSNRNTKFDLKNKMRWNWFKIRHLVLASQMQKKNSFSLLGWAKKTKAEKIITKHHLFHKKLAKCEKRKKKEVRNGLGYSSRAFTFSERVPTGQTGPLSLSDKLNHTGV